DRKAAEVALAESQKQYQNLVENSPDIIERFDLELRHLYISPALTKMTGISAAEFLGKTCRDLGMDENMINNWESAASRLRATGQRQAIEFETPTLNGIRSFEMAIVPELSDQQTIESMLCISRDISDRKQFAATLQQRLQREQSLNRVFQSIRQSFELEIIFATATAETSRLLGGLNCNVVQYLPAQGIWKRIVEFRSEPNRPPHVGLEIPDAGNPVAEQLKRLQTVRIESTDQLTDPISQDIARALPGAWLLIPLQVENRVWGSFTLSTQEQPFAWTDEQVELAQTVAAQLEVAIQQAELYQQVEQEKQNLLKSQTALLQAQQIAQVGSWELDAATQAMVWSDTLYQIFGFDPALPELDFAEVMMNHVHPEDRPRLEQALMQAMTQGIAYEIDLRIFRADGSMGYMEARAEAMRNEQGDIVKIFGTSLDISDRKQAEQQLQTLVEATAATTGQDFFPTLVSHMATALNVTYALVTEEVDGMLHALAFWANGALQPTFVYHPAKTPCEWTLRDGMFYCPCLVQQIFPQDLDLVQMGAESYLGIALRDSQGRAIGNLCILNTQPIPEPQQAENLLRVFAARASAELERERATQALEQLNQELEAIVSQRTAALTQRTMQLEVSNKELESFSYSVSHDLRAPLRHVNGFVNALQQRLQNHAALSDPKVVHYLQVIENSSQKMAQLIDGLLALSRIGRKPITYSPVSLRELVDEAIALAQNNPDTTIPVEFVIGELPTIQGDAALLQQVLSNLIGNAVKFSCHHPTPRIEIGSLPGGTIFIRDNGVGFQMEYADKLFGAFQRLHAQTEFEGTGIGLAIVQRIIHRHGGTIWAESQPNQGATFHFTLGNAVER
ncbi:MAG: PAS domain S-box protein, partial [Cyanobacteria bacterium CAN_BIN43]|nr:PAS domain S-box protein [Cyanobacteria bacterium CAN_BIN43]